MQKTRILLSDIDRVKRFNAITVKRPENVDLQSGRYIIDAKSIMGCFSLNLVNPVELLFHSDDVSAFEEYLKDIHEFIV